MLQPLGYYSSMGEKIEIDKEELTTLIQDILAESKKAGEEVEADAEEIADEVEDDAEEIADEGEKTLSDMTPKEIEAFFAKAVQNAMSELDTKKTVNSKKVKPAKPRPRDEEEDEDGKQPVKTRHDEKREGQPVPPPKKRRSFWGDDE